MRAAIYLVALTGCDVLFDLNHVGPASDASVAQDGGVGGDAFDVAQCPAQYDAALTAGSRYRIIATTAAAWMQSDDCNDDQVGATHLVALDDAAELSAAQAELNTRGQLGWYVGAVQSPLATTTRDMWNWIVGEPVTVAWSTVLAQPDDGDAKESDHAEQFAVLQRNRTGLSDVAGGDANNALCECDGRAPVDYVRGWVDGYRP